MRRRPRDIVWTGLMRTSAGTLRSSRWYQLLGVTTALSKRNNITSILLRVTSMSVAKGLGILDFIHDSRMVKLEEASNAFMDEESGKHCSQHMRITGRGFASRTCSVGAAEERDA